LRTAAGALSAAPIGFAVGALSSGRLLLDDGVSDATGVAILGFALLGAVVAAVAMGLAARLAPPKPARIATIAAGFVSFAILAYMASDFIVDRLDRAREFDAAYALLPSFEVVLESRDRHRRPFSKLTFVSDGPDSRDYQALRPGGWFCRGSGRREHRMALFQAIRAAEQDPPVVGDCARLASWSIAGETPVANRCAEDGIAFAALFATADEMVEVTERRASCRRATDLQSSEPTANIDVRGDRDGVDGEESV